MNQNKKIILITGAIAAGKSKLLEFIKNKGNFVISSDEIVVDLYKDSLVVEKIKKLFPKAVSDNKIDKNKLRNLILSREENKKTLNSIIHSLVVRKIEELVNLSSYDIIFIEIPLLADVLTLLEEVFKKFFVVFVDADKNIRKQRLKARSGLEDDEVEKFIEIYPYIENKRIADMIIYNNGTEIDFKNEVDRLLYELIGE